MGVGQPLGQRRQRPARARRQPGAGDPQRQRQVATAAGHLGGRLRLGRHPLLIGQAAEQLDRLPGGQDAEVQVVAPWRST
jgi:hypothetical protein